MAEPYDRPGVGSGAKLYRMTRDNAYYVAGTVLSLLPEQVNPQMHELVSVDSPDSADRRAAFATLHDRMKVLEAGTGDETKAALAKLDARVTAIETHAIAEQKHALDALRGSLKDLETKIANLEPKNEQASEPSKTK